MDGKETISRKISLHTIAENLMDIEPDRAKEPGELKLAKALH